MDLYCKGIDCGSVYCVKIVGSGCGFVGLVAVGWKCNVCGRWNFYINNVKDDVKVTL